MLSVFRIGISTNVRQVNVSKVSFLWRGLDHVVPVSNFLEDWSGVVLLAETSEKSIEPIIKNTRETTG
jgi:hypothetical protein